MERIIVTDGRTHPLVCRCMTPDTICLDDTDAGFLNPDDLRLCTKSKDGCVPESILGLKEILVKYIVVWYMTVVANGNFAMRTVLPCRVLGSHQMTVNARLRVIGQVRVSTTHVKKKSPNTCQDGSNSPYIHFPITGWTKKIEEPSYAHVLNIAKKANVGKY